MKNKLLLLTAFVAITINAFCQAGNNGFTCATAIRLCSLDSFSVSQVTSGDSIYTPSCFGLNMPDDQRWYSFTVNTSGQLAWLCQPTDTNIELDWALYDITHGCPTKTTAQNYVDCNFNYAGQHSRPVGMSATSATNCPPDSAAAPPYSASKEICPSQTVAAGHTYAIFINNYSYPTVTGWNINFTGSTFQIWPPQASFSVSPDSICATNDTVHITNTTGSDIAARLWNFGDGTTDTAVNPAPHYYAQPGRYVITLTDSATGGCTNTVTRLVNINPADSLPPTTQQMCPGLQVTVSAPVNTANTYLWSTGATTQSVTVNATTDSVYTVVCTLPLGCTVTGTTNLVVTNNPVITISIADSLLCAGSQAVLVAMGGGAYNWGNGLGSNDTITVAPVSTTTYIVIATLGAGCQGTGSKTVVVHQPAQSQYTDSVCNGLTYFFNGQYLSQPGTYHTNLQTIWGCDSAVTLHLLVDTLLHPTITQTGNTLQTQSFYAYQWLLNGQFINGATNQYLLITQSGTYTVIVSNANGCLGNSDTLNVIYLGINEATANYGVKLFPNPGNGNFTIQCTDNLQHIIEITDAVGRTIIAPEKITGQKQFNLTAFATGIYFLQIRNNNNTQSLKFCVVR